MCVSHCPQIVIWKSKLPTRNQKSYTPHGEGKAKRPVYLHHVSAHHQCVVLGDKFGKVDKRRSVLWLARQHKDLRAVVLHVFVHVSQLVNICQRCLVGLRLSRRAPIDV